MRPDNRADRDDTVSMLPAVVKLLNEGQVLSFKMVVGDSASSFTLGLGKTETF